MKQSRYLLFFFIFVFLILFSVSAKAIGISPSKIEIRFEPNFEKSYNFVVSGVNTDIETYIIEDEELKNMVSLTVVEGTGDKRSFKAIVKLPSSSNGLKPGKHRTLVGVKEKAKESSGMSVVTAVQVPIDVLIPYHDAYIETKLEAEDFATNSTGHFTIYLTNLGTKATNVFPIIYVYEENGKEIYNENLSTVLVNAEETKKIIKEWNSSGKKEGVYKAKVVANYNSNFSESLAEFKIGSVLIEIINYTEKIYSNSINKFYITIKSKWNSEIKNAYFEIVVKKNGKDIASFKTENFDIKPWETKTIKDYFDSEGIEKGIYDITIIANYEGKQNSISGTIKINEKIGFSVVSVIGMVVVVLVIILIILAIIRKKKNNKTTTLKKHGK